VGLRNTPNRIAPWFRSRNPAVIYVDQFTIDAMKRATFPIKGPTAPGFWWSADDGWNGPFASSEEAAEKGRDFLKAAGVK
jgi:hypothetical protein